MISALGNLPVPGCGCPFLYWPLGGGPSQFFDILNSYSLLFATKNIIIALKSTPFLKSFQTIFTSYRGPTPKPDDPNSQIILAGGRGQSPIQFRLSKKVDQDARQIIKSELGHGPDRDDVVAQSLGSKR
jgi:hypothetical protein